MDPNRASLASMPANNMVKQTSKIDEARLSTDSRNSYTLAKLSVSDVTKETKRINVDTFRNNRYSLPDKTQTKYQPAHGDEIFNNSEHQDDEERKGNISMSKTHD